MFSDQLEAWADRHGGEADLAGVAVSGQLDARVDAAVARAGGREGLRRGGSVELERWGRSRLRLRIFDAEDTLRLTQLLDGASGAVLATHEGRPATPHAPPRGRSLARFLRDLHVNVLLPSSVGLFVSGVAGAALLLLLATGVFVAWPRRRRLVAGLRTRSLRAWLGDGHALLGLVSAPFLALVTWSGVMLSLSVALVVLLLGLVAGIDEASASRALMPQVTVAPGATLAPLGPLVADAAHRSDAPVGSVSLRRGDGGGMKLWVHAKRPGWRLSTRSYVFDAHRGVLLWQGREVGAGQEDSAGTLLIGLTHGLHEGNLAGLATQWPWFVLGLLCSALFASGAALWALRRAGAEGRTFGVVVTATLGLPLALLLVPLGWAGATLTDLPATPLMAFAFFGGAGSSALLGLLRPIVRTVRVLLAATAGAALVLPFAGHAATGAASWHAPTAFGVDLAFLALGACFGALAFRPPRVPALRPAPVVAS